MLRGALSYISNPNASFFSKEGSADQLNSKWIALRECFRIKDCILEAYNSSNEDRYDFIIDINAHHHNSKIARFSILTECPLVHPNNSNFSILKKYDAYFTWNNEVLKLRKAHKILIPHHLNLDYSLLGSCRDLFITLISANKSLPKFLNTRDLYQKRVEIIRWMEKNNPNDFSLYGFNWHLSPKLPSKAGTALHYIESKLPFSITHFPSWKGIVETKKDILKRSKFTIAYENVKGYDCYITEKIFDAFVSLSVPIYLGASNISSLISTNCFIDARNYTNISSLFHHLKSMTDDEYNQYQHNIINFINSRKSYKFSNQYFAETVSEAIIKHFL